MTRLLKTTLYERLSAENERGRQQVNKCNERISKLIIQLESLRRTKESFQHSIAANDAKLREIEAMQPNS